MVKGPVSGVSSPTARKSRDRARLGLASQETIPERTRHSERFDAEANRLERPHDLGWSPNPDGGHGMFLNSCRA